MSAEDEARAEAERLHREGYETGGFEAGAAWQRARIAARRDEAVRDLVPALAHLAANMSREERHAVARVLVDAALAALEVSDR